MPIGVALPHNMSLSPDEVAVTVVVPAPNGCNLNCPFCFIKARKEALPSQSVLQAADYVQFIESMIEQQNVTLVSLQGYEPLLPESWSISKAILAKAREHGVRTALVTNGTHLADRVDELVALDVSGITVSLDSDQAIWHDQTRRMSGAYAMTISGIERVAASKLRSQLIVASVLQRRKSLYLAGMPGLLAGLGLRNWVVTPVIKVGKDIHKTSVAPPADVVRELKALYNDATSHGVTMMVDDEFDVLIRNAEAAVDLAQLRLRRLSRINQAIRLSPDGSCSVGESILDRADASDLVWNPQQESAGHFAGRVALAL